MSIDLGDLGGHKYLNIKFWNGKVSKQEKGLCYFIDWRHERKI